jgi:hypothetical protein
VTVPARTPGGATETTHPTDEDGDVDLADPDAFAMLDHQAAHVYADDRVADARTAISELDGVDSILDETDRGERGIDHPNAGDLVAVADSDVWFQYY